MDDAALMVFNGGYHYTVSPPLTDVKFDPHGAQPAYDHRYRSADDQAEFLNVLRWL